MKVDESGVRMVEAIVQLARLFRMKVVAEGIEQEEANLLRNLACEFGGAGASGDRRPGRLSRVAA